MVNYNYEVGTPVDFLLIRYVHMYYIMTSFLLKSSFLSLHINDHHSKSHYSVNAGVQSIASYVTTLPKSLPITNAGICSLTMPIMLKAIQ